ncbi:neural proliferation differentiation and control protein 1a isoform X1 [Xiphophorus couchianus]|uniref:neural proliferation differentiation and control protein 1a isoform X1 n=1 Tax=Xiphophorus couchianus TaxID=32473 RepID=UPI001015CDE2|nr:neural proliferation differentiation and control protein 1-like isoform X1 [Xiphophorus couchianus]
MLLLLFSSPRCGHQHRASLPLLFAAALPLLMLLCHVPVSASLPAHKKCPPPIDCARQRRHHCHPPSSDCGSCLFPFRENDEGRCMPKTHHKNGKVRTFTDLDEEIDFLHSIIEKQEVSKIKTTKNQPQKTGSISSPADLKDSRTGASEQKSQNKNRLSGEIPRSTTAAPIPTGAAVPNTPTPHPRFTAADGRAGPLVVPHPKNDTIIVIIISLCVIVGTVCVILASVCYVKLRTESRLAEKVDYPAFRGPSVPPTPANGSSTLDKTLAENAQMYHYQHQKQQMLSMGSHKPEQKGLDAEATSDEEEVGGGFTVYECPGLAPTGEMEVKNPLFDDSTLDYQGIPK